MGLESSNFLPPIEEEGDPIAENSQLARSLSLRGLSVQDSGEWILKTGESDGREEKEGVTLGTGDGGFLQYLSDKWGLNWKGDGAFLEAKPHNLTPNTEVSGTYHSMFMGEGEPWEFQSGIQDKFSMTITRGGFQTQSGIEKGYLLTYGERKNNKGLEEKRVTFGVSFIDGEKGNFKGAISQVFGEYKGEGFEQTILQASTEAQFLSGVLRASGYVISVADLGRLEDGSTVVIGSSEDVLVFDKDKNIDVSTISGLNLSRKKVFDQKQKELLLSVNIAKGLEEKFGQEYGIHFGQLFNERRNELGFTILTDGQDEYEIAGTLGSFFKSFGDDQFSLEFELGYGSKDGIISGITGRYYLEPKSESKFKLFTNDISMSRDTPELDRVSNK